MLNNKKIPCIPPMLHWNRYITEYKDKAELFKNVFLNQCFLINHSRVLPSVLFIRTKNLISSINFTSVDIAEIIQKLDPNKGHGLGINSILMLKIFGNSIYKPLQFNFPILHWEREILFSFIRKVINKHWKITILCLCF